MGRRNEVLIFFLPELSLHIDEEFTDDQAHLNGLAHGITLILKSIYSCKHKIHFQTSVQLHSHWG